MAAVRGFFVTNNTAVSNPGPGSTESDVFEIIIGQSGIGNIMMSMTGGGVFAVDAGSSSQSFEVGVSDTGDPLHEVLKSLPLLGDTTANQALLFSPSFLAPSPAAEQAYPNYTLPLANLTFPDPPALPPNFTILIGPVSAFPEFDYSQNAFSDGTPVTLCSLSIRPNLTALSGSFGSVQSPSLVLRNADGWRYQWLVDGLQPLTNYTVFTFENEGRVSGPINVVTKSASFSCPLVHSLPYCPLVSYAVPLPAPSGPPGTETYDASSLPDSISDPLLSYLTNFTTSLLSFACGRDLYSPLVSCADCQAEYRTWLCAAQLPRCGDAAADPGLSTPSSRKLKRDAPVQTTFISPALIPHNASSVRNPNLPDFPGGNWTELLPCLEPRFNADVSYGVGYIDGDMHSSDWEKLGGMTKKAQDRWGNVWCNGPGLIG
ncbi:hypothetical protein EW145_g6263 [Phellinidium pouzarii]|uniref:Stretch-activated cation channel Mid1 n=1 Tax=Phellinidium pouzarii TaxID=167371 RepID=A0A4S4L1V1_9AGAM|nr:hypothetical protein EW145_g6263 [Phellinidium pouzarii]